jgi:RND family efflux transporter MFP subunit
VLPDISDEPTRIMGAQPDFDVDVDVDLLVEHEARLSRRRGSAWIVAASAVALLVITAVAAAVVHATASREPDRREGPRVVPVMTVMHDDGARALRASGLTRSAQRADLSFTVGGRLVERPVEVGDRLTSEDLIARIDPRGFENALAAADARTREVRANLGRAYRVRRRTRVLSDEDITSTADLEQATANVAALHAARAAARSQGEEAQRLLSETLLKAPFDGVVEAVLVEPGEFVSPGQPIAILSGDTGMEVEVEVPESLVHRIAEDDRVMIDLPLADISGLTGVVRRVGASAGSVGRQFPVVVRLDSDERIVPGMAAEVTFTVRTGHGISVPIESVIDPGGDRPAVVVVREGRAERVEVEVVDLVEDRARVRGEVVVDELVIVGGHGALVTGSEVIGRPVDGSGEAEEGAQ